jgi:hypothetical protein
MPRQAGKFVPIVQINRVTPPHGAAEGADGGVEREAGKAVAEDQNHGGHGGSMGEKGKIVNNDELYKKGLLSFILGYKIKES